MLIPRDGFFYMKLIVCCKCLWRSLALKRRKLIQGVSEQRCEENMWISCREITGGCRKLCSEKVHDFHSE